MSDGRPNWPPTFEEARSERLEALGLIIKLTGIDEAAYNQFVELAEEILADPDFRRLQSTFARGVVACPLLDAEGVADLARAMGFPVTGVADAVIPDQGATPA
jgi:hypothetical protein